MATMKKATRVQPKAQPQAVPPKQELATGLAALPAPKRPAVLTHQDEWADAILRELRAVRILLEARC